jgi:broad specificity phosphatase PhoE
MRIYIVRHGETAKNNIKNSSRNHYVGSVAQSESNLNPKYQIDYTTTICFPENHGTNFSGTKIRVTKKDSDGSDSHLNTTGYRQCEKIAHHISYAVRCNKNYGYHDKKIIKIIINTSPVIRTVQTSEHIKKTLLDEHNKFDVMVVKDQRLYDQNDKNDRDKIIELENLIDELYVKHKNRPDHIIILVTHNHIIELFYKMTEGMETGKKKFYNGSISTLDIMINPDGSALRGQWDSIDHMAEHQNE